MTQPIFYVKDNSLQPVAATFLTDASGTPILDPNYSTAAFQNIYNISGTQINGGTALNSYNPNGYLIVPVSYSLSDAATFATFVRDTMNTPVTGPGGTEIDGLPTALGLMAGAFLPGGSQDLQRTYNGTSYGPSGTHAVLAFTDAASWNLGYVTANGDMPLSWANWGGGLLNSAFNVFVRTIPMDEMGDGSLTSANANSSAAGYDFAQNGNTTALLAPFTAYDVSLGGESGDAFSTATMSQSTDGQFQILQDFKSGGSESDLFTYSLDGSGTIVTNGYSGTDLSGTLNYQQDTTIESDGQVFATVAGNGDTASLNNADISVDSSDSATISGSGNTIEVAAGATLTISAGSSGNSTNINGTGATVDDDGSGDYVNIWSSDATVELGAGATGSTAFDLGSGGTNITMNGDLDTGILYATGSTVTATGDDVYIEMDGTGETADNLGSDSYINIGGSGNTLNDIGTGGNTIQLSGTDNVVVITAVLDYTIATVYGSDNDVFDLGGLESSIILNGDSDSGDVYGDDSNITAYGTSDYMEFDGTLQNGIIYGSDETVGMGGTDNNLNDEGTGDNSINLGGTGNTITLGGDYDTVTFYDDDNAVIMNGDNDSATISSGVTGSYVGMYGSNDSLTLGTSTTANIDTDDTNGGSITLDSGSVAELLGASSANIVYNWTSGSEPLLKIDDAEDFTGTVAGLEPVVQFVYLADFAYANGPTITSVTGSQAAGATLDVHITDGALSTTLHILNQYANQYLAYEIDDTYSILADTTPGMTGTLFRIGPPARL